MPDINITYATIGGARLAVVNNGDRDNFASTLLISYVNTDRAVPTTFNYNAVVTIGGVPLSVSLYINYGKDPSVGQNAMFYALDVIENTADEDPGINTNPSMEDSIIIPYDPSDRTFTWNGNRLSASKKSDRYYMNIVDSGNLGEGDSQFTLMGVPMGQGSQNELILNRTSYTMGDINEYVNIMIGGSPLTAGRIGNNYYIVVAPLVENPSVVAPPNPSDIS